MIFFVFLDKNKRLIFSYIIFYVFLIFSVCPVLALGHGLFFTNLPKKHFCSPIFVNFEKNLTQPFKNPRKPLYCVQLCIFCWKSSPNPTLTITLSLTFTLTLTLTLTLNNPIYQLYSRWLFWDSEIWIWISISSLTSSTDFLRS